MTPFLDYLANPAKLGTFVNAISGMVGATVSWALTSIVEMLERQLCLRSDDLDEARRLGRLVQVVRVQSHPAPHRRARR
jgi:hypothetical protein